MNNIVLGKLKENQDRFVSGQELSDILGVSRTAIWKYINELRQEGYTIQSSSKRGYKLVSSADMLNAAEVQYNLETKILGKCVYYFNTVDSTNNYSKKIASEGCGDGTVVIADSQTAGRGRLGRQWISGHGKGIWMSVVLFPHIAPEDVQIITLGASVAVVRAIKNVTGLSPVIKWPNDILLEGRKICGILTEMSSETDKVNFLVLGIGINVNHEIDDFPGDLKNIAGSLRILALNTGSKNNGINAGSFFSRSEIVKRVLFELEQVYIGICKGNNDEILKEWKEYSVTLGKSVMVTVKNSMYTGIAKNITGDGKLVVHCSDGIVREVLSGEVSVKGINSSPSPFSINKEGEY